MKQTISGPRFSVFVIHFVEKICLVKKIIHGPSVTLDRYKDLGVIIRIFLFHQIWKLNSRKET